MKKSSKKSVTGFARRLRAARVSLGYTQEEFSLHLGIKRDRYAKYELGQAEPPFFILMRVSELTSQSLDVLIGSRRHLSGESIDVIGPQLADIRSVRKIQDAWWWKSDRAHRVVEVWHLHTLIPQSDERPRIIGKTRWEMAGADPKTDAFWRQHLTDLDAHRPFSNFEYEVTTKSGDIRTIVLSGRPVFNENQEFMGYAGSGHRAVEQTGEVGAENGL